jgi:periplasmic mercuric ion binding protein
MCPFSCWPKVKETLASQPGVEGVQLVAQAKEGTIDNPVVELKTNKDFNPEAAIAALKKVNFDDAVVVK